jgi:2-polyprenyl-3-methyl-5-hydroxy-6-metoxy-1,4-benzoquinol methylase
MVKTIDYYEHWNKVRQKRNFLLDREKVALKFISSILKHDSVLLDAGCGSGIFMEFLSKKFQDLKLQGIDFSKTEVNEAKQKGFDVKQGDFEKGIAFKDKVFDIVYAGEIIEHLYNPDCFLAELNRILKNQGYLVLSTPNLCVWYNRILMLLGIQPLFLEPSTKSKLVGAGFLKRFKKESQPVGHVRIFTFEALKDMLKMNGFKIEAVKGAVFEEGFPKSVLMFDRIFKVSPKLSSHFVILARKMQEK